MVAGVESEAVFVSRARAIGLSQANVDLFVAAGVGTMAKLAFACQYQPGAPDEQPLVDLFATVLTRAATLGAFLKVPKSECPHGRV